MYNFVIYSFFICCLPPLLWFWNNSLCPKNNFRGVSFDTNLTASRVQPIYLRVMYDNLHKTKRIYLWGMNHLTLWWMFNIYSHKAALRFINCQPTTCFSAQIWEHDFPGHTLYILLIKSISSAQVSYTNLSSVLAKEGISIINICGTICWFSICIQICGLNVHILIPFVRKARTYHQF